MKVLLVLLMIVAVCVTTMSALQCYDCDVAIDINCGYGRSDYRQMTCDEIIPEEIPETTTAKRRGFRKNQKKEEVIVIVSVCYKLIAEVNGMNQTTRSCSEKGGDLDPCKEPHVFCDSCEEDLCNGIPYVEESTEEHPTDHHDASSNLSLTKTLIIFVPIMFFLSTTQT